MSFFNKASGKISEIISTYSKYKYKNFQRKSDILNISINKQLIKLYPQGQIAELLFTSDFEKDEINLVSQYIQPNHNIIDIGANIGLYAVLFRKLSSGNVTAFEPSSESYDRLVRNLELNGINDIKLYKAALSDTPDQYLELIRRPGYKDGDRHLNTGGVDVNGGDVEKVFCTTLDSFFSNKEKIDFIKIDIEGGELNAFKGAKELLSNNPQLAIMFECTKHNCSQFDYERDEVFVFLESFGFSIYAWDKISNEWVPGRDYLDKSENFWAIKDIKKLPRA